MIFVVGPSAVGKSAVALELAQLVNGEIISCDSMQVYQEIRIASDRPSENALKEIKHHLTGCVSVEAEFNAASYRAMALDAIKSIESQNKIPVFCGGTGMYMMAVLDGLFEGGGPQLEVRDQLMSEAEAKGTDELYSRLKKADPEAANVINPHDLRRIIRALEVLETSGQTMSSLKGRRDGLWGKRNIHIFALSRERDVLYKRAENRVEQMFKQGLVDEVRGVLKKKLNKTVSRLIGIPEVKGHLEGAYDISQAIYLMKLNTRHYIKRQLTWFRREKRAEWLHIKEEDPLCLASSIHKMIK